MFGMMRAVCAATGTRNLEKTKQMLEDKLIIFDWGGVIEDTSKYPKCWDMIKKVCGVEEAFNLRDYYLSHIEMEYIDNKPEFIKQLNEMLEGIDMRNIPKGRDDHAIAEDGYQYSKGEYLYSIYQIVCNGIPFRRDVSSLLSELPSSGIRSALLSDVGMWDLKRQNFEVDTSLCSFDWRSCHNHSSKRGGGLFKICKRDLGHAGIDPRDVLFIDDNEKNLEMAEKECGWNTYLDKDYENSEELKKIIDRFVREV